MVKLFIVEVNNEEGDITLRGANKVLKSLMFGTKSKFRFEKDEEGAKHCVTEIQMNHATNRRLGRVFMKAGYGFKSFNAKGCSAKEAVQLMINPAPAPVEEEGEEVIFGNADDKETKTPETETPEVIKGKEGDE